MQRKVQGKRGDQRPVNISQCVEYRAPIQW